MPCINMMTGQPIAGASDRGMCVAYGGDWVEGQPNLLEPPPQQQTQEQSDMFSEPRNPMMPSKLPPSGTTSIGNNEWNVSDIGGFFKDPEQAVRDYARGNSPGDAGLDAAMAYPAVRGAGYLGKKVLGSNLFKNKIVPAVSNLFKSTATKVKPIKHATTGKPIPRMINKQKVGNPSEKFPDGVPQWKTKWAVNKDGTFKLNTHNQKYKVPIKNKRGQKSKLMERVPMTDKAGNIMYQTKRQFDVANTLTTGGLLAGGASMLGPDGVPQRPEGVQGPLSKDGGFYPSSPGYKPGEQMANEPNVEYTPAPTGEGLPDGKEQSSLWDNIQSKDWWFTPVPGGAGSWDNRLLRLGEMMNYMGTPLSKRGDSPTKRWTTANTESQKVSAGVSKAAVAAGSQATKAQRRLWTDMVKAQQPKLINKYMSDRGGWMGIGEMTEDEQMNRATSLAQDEMVTKYRMIGLGIEPTKANYIMFLELLQKEALEFKRKNQVRS